MVLLCLLAAVEECLLLLGADAMTGATLLGSGHLGLALTNSLMPVLTVHLSLQSKQAD